METTTETLFATLSPEAREEALRLAARLQAHDGESVGLVAAARAAGIEDRFLREAVGRMATPPAPTVVPATTKRAAPALTDARAAALLLLGAIFALVHASARFGSGFPAYVLAFLLPFAIAALAPGRSRWLAPGLVVVAGAIVHLMMRMNGSWSGFAPFSYLLRAIGIETVLAILGAFVASRLGAATSSGLRSDEAR